MAGPQGVVTPHNHPAAAPPPTSSFAVDFATLAREIAQDIFPVEQIVSLHRLTDEEWARIQAHPKFVAILGDMQREWNSAENTRQRIKVKAQTGLEAQLEVFIQDINDPSIPLAQRVEAGKFLARLGELDGVGGRAGEGVQIVLNIGDTTKSIEVAPKSITIDAD